MNVIVNRHLLLTAKRAGRARGSDAGTPLLAGSEALLRVTEAFQHTVELSTLIPWTCDPQGDVVHFDARWAELTGGSTNASPASWAQQLHPDELEVISENWFGCLAAGEIWEAEHRLRVRDGTYRWFRSRAVPRRSADGTIVRWYGTTDDVHDRKVAELKMHWQAEHDSLTRLPNRTRFHADLEEAILDGRSSGAGFGLLIVNVDDFRTVNDQLSHEAGDHLLAALANILGSLGHPVFRLGGDEFAFIVKKDAPGRATRDLMRAITAEMEQPLEFAGLAHRCGVTIGGAIFPQHGDDTRELLKSAEMALHVAKAAGRRHSKMFESGMRKTLQERASMLSLARDALASDVVVPFYQPKVDLASGAIEGFEALLRWDHARLGHQLPASIWAAFEHPELGFAIGERMLDKILADVGNWLRQRIQFGRISINISSAEIVSGDYAEKLLARMARADIPCSAIEIEVTERVFLARSGDVVDQTLRTLSEAGISIALDDFGTGFASLTHLRRFPVDVLKIDRSFVQTLGTDRMDGAIVDAVVGMAGALGIKTVAEGIETAAQADWLSSCGCTQGQGFLFGKASPASAVPRILDSCDMKSRWSNFGRKHYPA